jgi:hypothetical protein
MINVGEMTGNRFSLVVCLFFVLFWLGWFLRGCAGDCATDTNAIEIFGRSLYGVDLVGDILAERVGL